MVVDKYRLYIDETGDHTYKQLDNPDTQYLGLTGVLFKKSYYDANVQPELEKLKQRIFKYDPDDPPILVRSLIIHHKRWFYVLQDNELNKQWEEGIISFLQNLQGHAWIFSVIIDKKSHLINYPMHTFDPYSYSLSVLLNRVRGFLVKNNGQADVVAEGRGKMEDQQIKAAYCDLRRDGSLYGKTGEYYKQAYPQEELIIKSKDNNIAGLQIADIIAFGQKVQTLISHHKTYARPQSVFSQRLNETVECMVNRYGRYLLE